MVRKSAVQIIMIREKITRIVWWLTVATILVAPLYVVRFNFGWLPLTFLEIMIWLSVAGVLFLATEKKMRCEYVVCLKSLPAQFYLASGLFLLTGLISIFVAPNLRAALGIYKAYFAEAIIFGAMVFLQLRTRKQVAQIIIAWGIAVFLIGCWSVVQKFTGWGIPNVFWRAVATRRVTGIFGYPNAVALFVEGFIPLGAAVIFWRGWRSRISWFLASAIILALVSVVLAQSAGAVAAIGAALFITLVILRRTRIWAIAAAIIFVVALILSPYQKQQFADQFLLQGYSGNLRTQMWGETLEMLRPHWFLGAGLAAYQSTVAPYHVFRWAEIYLYPHNIFLTLWSESGLLGLFSFTWLIILLFFAAAQIYRSPQLGKQIFSLAMLSWIIIFLVHGLVDVPYFKNDLAVLFWAVVATLLFTRYTKNSDN